MRIPRPLKELREGINLGRKARQLFSEFRVNEVDPTEQKNKAPPTTVEP